MNVKLVGLLVAVVVVLLGIVIAMLSGKPDQPNPVAVTTAPPPVERDNARDGSFTKSKPGNYGYSTPK